MLELKLTRYTMKICLYPQYIFLNMTTLPLSLQVRENNYTYSSIILPPREEEVYYKEYLKMGDMKLMEESIVKSLYK